VLTSPGGPVISLSSTWVSATPPSSPRRPMSLVVCSVSDRSAGSCGLCRPHDKRLRPQVRRLREGDLRDDGRRGPTGPAVAVRIGRRLRLSRSGSPDGILSSDASVPRSRTGRRGSCDARNDRGDVRFPLDGRCASTLVSRFFRTGRLRFCPGGTACGVQFVTAAPGGHEGFPCAACIRSASNRLWSRSLPGPPAPNRLLHCGFVPVRESAARHADDGNPGSRREDAIGGRRGRPGGRRPKRALPALRHRGPYSAALLRRLR
jgi:hypothetical protein